MEDFTITHIGDTALSLPMPFKYLGVKTDKNFKFQADDGSNLGSKHNGIPITFENDFWMCIYQTTQEFWEVVVKANITQELKPNPSYFKGKTRPVEQVSWDDVQLFNSALNRLFKEGKLSFEKKTKPLGEFALPSETQWEYAANAGQGLVFAGSQNLNDVAWYNENSNEQTMHVGLKEPNAWALHDMIGNVWEWCADNFAQNIAEIPKNGQPNLQKDQYQVLRGGSYNDCAEFCRLWYRRNYRPGNRSRSLGFRLGFSPSSAYESERAD
jgi:formylglycine-generating enzyme required for sulfatase activity